MMRSRSLIMLQNMYSLTICSILSTKPLSRKDEIPLGMPPVKHSEIDKNLMKTKEIE